MVGVGCAAGTGIEEKNGFGWEKNVHQDPSDP